MPPAAFSPRSSASSRPSSAAATRRRRPLPARVAERASGSATRWRARACSTRSCATWPRRASASRAPRSSATSRSRWQPSQAVQDVARRRLPRRRPGRRRSASAWSTSTRASGVALPPRQDGRADDRRQGGHRRLVGRGVPAHDALRRRPSPTCGRCAAGCEPAGARTTRRFRVAERLLLTGHSHQAWPDVALEGQRRGLRGRRARTWTRSGGARSPRPTRCARACGCCSPTRAARSPSASTPTSSSSACSRPSTCAGARGS